MLTEMSLKVAVILMIGGLVAQSSAFAVKTLRGESAADVPSFTYTADKTAEHEKLSLKAPKGGKAFLYPVWLAHKGWAFQFANGVPQITRKVSTPFTYVEYDVLFSVGEFSGSGLLIAQFGNSTYNLTLKATGDDKKCQLKAEIASPKLHVFFEFGGLGEEGKAFEAPSVISGLTLSEKQTVEGVFSTVMAELTTKVLPDFIDYSLCKKLLVATAEDFPKPKIATSD